MTQSLNVVYKQNLIKEFLKNCTEKIDKNKNVRIKTQIITE